jgi:hypothetical protein
VVFAFEQQTLDLDAVGELYWCFVVDCLAVNFAGRIPVFFIAGYRSRMKQRILLY